MVIEESNRTIEVKMKPIPYRHFDGYFMAMVQNWAEKEFPQISKNITEISFESNGVVISYLKRKM